MIRRIIALLIGGFLYLPGLVGTAASVSSEANGVATVSETLEGVATTSGGQRWTWAYRARLSRENVEIFLPIQFVLAPGVTRVAFEERWVKWLRKVETTWNRRFSFRFPDGSTRPVRVIVREDGRDALHRVVVRPGSGRTDMLNWYLSDNGRVIAHEIGHLLGIADEDRATTGSSRDTDMDYESVMGHHRHRKGVIQKEHLERLRNWVEEKTGRFPLETFARGTG